jgi:ubiquinone/menaquinone biosynthesis C-methylase UbiE
MSTPAVAPQAPPTFTSQAAPLLAAAKERSYDLLRLEAGHSVLDVGCGPGSDTLALAARVGESGFVMGVDSAKAFVESAERRALAAGLGARVHHRIVNALALPFRAASFDACRSERTFQLLATPQRALAEMARVTRPGGRVVLLDIDWGSASIDSPYPDVERLLKRLLADHLLPNPYSGRSIYRQMRTQGLQAIELEVMPLVITSLGALRQLTHLDRSEGMALERALLSEERLARWRAALEEADASDSLFAQVSLVLVAGAV